MCLVYVLGLFAWFVNVFPSNIQPTHSHSHSQIKQMNDDNNKPHDNQEAQEEITELQKTRRKCCCLRTAK